MEKASVLIETRRGDMLAISVEDEGNTIVSFISLEPSRCSEFIWCVMCVLLVAPFVYGNGLGEIVAFYFLIVLCEGALWLLHLRLDRWRRGRLRKQFRHQLRQEPSGIARDITQIVLDNNFSNWIPSVRKNVLPGVRTVATGSCASEEQSRLYAEADPDEPVRLEAGNASCWIARGRVAIRDGNGIFEYNANDALLVHVDQLEGEWATLRPHDDAYQSHTFNDSDTNLSRLWTWWNAPGPPAPPLTDRIPQ